MVVSHHVVSGNWTQDLNHLSIPFVSFYCFCFCCCCCFVLFLRQGFCPGTHSVDQAGLEPRNLSVSAFLVLGFKAWATTAWPVSVFDTSFLLDGDPSHPVSASPTLELWGCTTIPKFSVGFWGSNSVAHICMTRTLPTELPPVSLLSLGSCLRVSSLWRDTMTMATFIKENT